ncbi:hypothetical protein CH63R_09464 [Colletotrichum higginsianum IMI 349063]|uniref:Uncharacterized protein n=1 Tax=Colletotrichum higginsianum (strain IMI 349063) TaxID=759273 RepID=A0A1B7Y7A0_COLHI|nr:hypothetical protein CH63R_09464 [Colletotrichum higginsianum IMI 349063]OBR07943.1 hypothetical protein CH63R_09464 [Colletotrichum higginsianum IMI 349063]
MASRYPMPQTYSRPAREKTGSPASTSSSIKSLFKMPQSYPVVSASASRYPLPTVYTNQKTSKSTPAAKAHHPAQRTSSPRASVESWDTIDRIKEEQTHV